MGSFAAEAAMAGTLLISRHRGGEHVGAWSGCGVGRR
jgi:hypothetical protein